MKANNILLVLFLFTFMFSKAQKVESTAYSLTLGNLLSHSVNEISVAEVKEVQPEAIFIDSRERNEFEVSHIKNALWVGYDSLDLSKVKKIDRDENLIVYCSVGYRSEKVAEKLDSMGFKNVKNLYGGIFEWKNQGNEVVNPAGQATDSVHAYNRIWGVWLKKGKRVY